LSNNKGKLSMDTSKNDADVYIYKRDDKVWPWGYYIKGMGSFVTDSKEDAIRNTKPNNVRKMRKAREVR
jgi:hypothetical protein